MDERFTLQKLLVLRKLTRAVADLCREHLQQSVATLAPLLRPRAVLGELVRGGTKESVKGAEQAFRDLQSIYGPIAASKLFDLPHELSPPLELPGSGLEVVPMEYAYTAKTERETKAITVVTPLKWVLSYAGYGPKQLKDLLAARASRTGDELRQAVLHCCVLHLILHLSKQTGVAELLARLRFTVSAGRLPELGELPITCVSSAVSTVRPPDGVVIERTELSGTPVFEEVVSIDDIIEMRDPLKDRILEMAKSYGENLIA